MPRFNWAVPTASLIYRLQQRGFIVTGIYDGEEYMEVPQGCSNAQARKMASEAIADVDAAHLHLRFDGFKATLFLVLGNDPDELVCDWSAHKELCSRVEDALDSFERAWEGKKCPTV